MGPAGYPQEERPVWQGQELKPGLRPLDYWVGLWLDGPPPTQAAKGTVPQSWRLPWALPAGVGGVTSSLYPASDQSPRSLSQTSYESNPEGLALSRAILCELWVTSLLYLLSP